MTFERSPRRLVQTLVVLTLCLLGWAAWQALSPDPRAALALWDARGRPLRQADLFVQRNLRFGAEGAEHALILRKGGADDVTLLLLRRSAAWGWRTLLEEEIEGDSPLDARLEDLSGDGIPEILVPTWHGSGGQSFAVCHYTPGKNAWTKLAEDLSNPVYLPKQRLLFTREKQGWGNYRATRSTWKNGQPVPQDGVSQHYVDDGHYLIYVTVFQAGLPGLEKRWISNTPHLWFEVPLSRTWEPADPLAPMDRLLPHP